MDTMTNKRIVAQPRGLDPFVTDAQNYLIGYLNDEDDIVLVSCIGETDDWLTGAGLIGDLIAENLGDPDVLYTFDITITDHETGAQREYMTRGFLMVTYESGRTGPPGTVMVFGGLGQTRLRMLRRFLESIHQDKVKGG